MPLIPGAPWCTLVLGMATLGQVVGGRLRQLREAAGVRQEDVAAAARLYGLEWTRGTVTAIERGQRQITLPELTMLALVLGRPRSASTGWAAHMTGGQLLAPHELLPDTAEEVDVGGYRMPAQVARRLLGERKEPPAAISGLYPVPRTRKARLAEEALGAAETKAAAALGVSPLEVVKAARKRWRHSLTMEREKRVLPAAGASQKGARTLQALRGHVTRALLEELGPMLKRTGRRAHR